MILLRRTVFLKNIYMNESHWLYTWQVYAVSKFPVEISDRVMEKFLILKTLRDNLRKNSEKVPSKSQVLLGVNLMAFTDLNKEISFHFL